MDAYHFLTSMPRQSASLRPTSRTVIVPAGIGGVRDQVPLLLSSASLKGQVRSYRADGPPLFTSEWANPNRVILPDYTALSPIST